VTPAFFLPPGGDGEGAGEGCCRGDGAPAGGGRGGSKNGAGGEVPRPPWPLLLVLLLLLPVLSVRVRLARSSSPRFSPPPSGEGGGEEKAGATDDHDAGDGGCPSAAEAGTRTELEDEPAVETVARLSDDDDAAAAAAQELPAPPVVAAAASAAAALLDDRFKMDTSGGISSFRAWGQRRRGLGGDASQVARRTGQRPTLPSRRISPFFVRAASAKSAEGRTATTTDFADRRRFAPSKLSPSFFFLSFSPSRRPRPVRWGPKTAQEKKGEGFTGAGGGERKLMRLL
jgi:hypothetical protein